MESVPPINRFLKWPINGWWNPDFSWLNQVKSHKNHHFPWWILHFSWSPRIFLHQPGRALGAHFGTTKNLAKSDQRPGFMGFFSMKNGGFTLKHWEFIMKSCGLMGISMGFKPWYLLEWWLICPNIGISSMKIVACWRSHGVDGQMIGGQHPMIYHYL